MKCNSYNVAIIGAGPAGSACGIELSHLGVDGVLLVDATAHDVFRIGESIPPEANVVLRKLRVLDAFLAENHEPCYGSCSWWGDDRRGYNDTLLSPYGHGWHLDRRSFDAFLSGQARAVGTELLTNTSFLHSRPTPHDRVGLTFRLADGTVRAIQAGIVVDASGSRGVYATRQGSRKIDTDPLVCLGTRFSLSGAPRTVSTLTHLEAVEYGWWYAARLPDEKLLVALYSDAETIRKRNLKQKEAFHRSLADTPNLRYLIEGLALIDPEPRGFAAPSFRRDKITGENWLAIGDAACAYDPITSQGILKSLTTGIHAAAVIAKSIEQGCNDFESYEVDVSSRYAQYLEMRRHFYRMENRWRESSFWRRRQSPNGDATVTEKA